jgi:LysM repeat protein
MRAQTGNVPSAGPQKGAGVKMNQIVGAVLVLTCGSLIGGCADHSRATVAAPPPAQEPARPTQQIVVQRGQSLDEIARTRRVSKHEIIQLNQLAAPYTLKAGATLLVPAVHAQQVKQTKAWPTAPAVTTKAAEPDRLAAVQPSRRTSAPRTKGEVIPLD